MNTTLQAMAQNQDKQKQYTNAALRNVDEKAGIDLGTSGLADWFRKEPDEAISPSHVRKISSIVNAVEKCITEAHQEARVRLDADASHTGPFFLRTAVDQAEIRIRRTAKKKRLTGFGIAYSLTGDDLDGAKSACDRLLSSRPPGQLRENLRRYTFASLPSRFPDYFEDIYRDERARIEAEARAEGAGTTEPARVARDSGSREAQAEESNTGRQRTARARAPARDQQERASEALASTRRDVKPARERQRRISPPAARQEPGTPAREAPRNNVVNYAPPDSEDLYGASPRGLRRLTLQRATALTDLALDNLAANVISGCESSGAGASGSGPSSSHAPQRRQVQPVPSMYQVAASSSDHANEAAIGSMDQEFAAPVGTKSEQAQVVRPISASEEELFMTDDTDDGGILRLVASGRRKIVRRNRRLLDQRAQIKQLARQIQDQQADIRPSVQRTMAPLPRNQSRRIRTLEAELEEARVELVGVRADLETSHKYWKAKYEKQTAQLQSALQANDAMIANYRKKDKEKEKRAADIQTTSALFVASPPRAQEQLAASGYHGTPIVVPGDKTSFLTSSSSSSSSPSAFDDTQKSKRASRFLKNLAESPANPHGNRTFEGCPSQEAEQRFSAPASPAPKTRKRRADSSPGAEAQRKKVAREAAPKFEEGKAKELPHAQHVVALYMERRSRVCTLFSIPLSGQLALL